MSTLQCQTRLVLSWYQPLSFVRYSERTFHAFCPNQRPQRKEVMPTRLATQCGQPEQASHHRQQARDSFRGNAQQLEIPADSAVCVKKMTKLYGPRVVAYLTIGAAPRQHADHAEQIILYGSPP